MYTVTIITAVTLRPFCVISKLESSLLLYQICTEILRQSRKIWKWSDWREDMFYDFELSHEFMITVRFLWVRCCMWQMRAGSLCLGWKYYTLNSYEVSQQHVEACSLWVTVPSNQLKAGVTKRYWNHGAFDDEWQPKDFKLGFVPPTAVKKFHWKPLKGQFTQITFFPSCSSWYPVICWDFEISVCLLPRPWNNKAKRNLRFVAQSTKKFNC